MSDNEFYHEALIRRLRERDDCDDDIGGACDEIEDCYEEIARLRAEVERLRANATNHNAAPAARADADRERPDNPPARPGDGTGDTPTLTDAERDAVEGALFDAERRGCRISAATLRNLLARLGGAS